MGTLSKIDILNHFKQGNIVIDPFNPTNLNNSSYDVRLGKFFYRQKRLDHTETLNPFYEKSVSKLYSNVQQAMPVKKIKSQDNPFHNLKDDDLIILVAPNETILAHTIEFIGGKNGTERLMAVTTEMRARSSIGRIGISVCKDAGWGDIGYINRWTMEITNFSSSIIPLPVGIRIAQIIFKEVTPVKNKDEYHALTGKYQSGNKLEKIKADWQPEMMLPRLYLDPDLRHLNDFY